MKQIKQLPIYFLAAIMLVTGCKKIDRLPETELSDASFWNTENDLVYACNRLYQELDGDWIDNRADDFIGQTVNTISSGNRPIPATSGDWNDRYDEIFTANNIIIKAPRAKVSDAIKNRYIAEAKFFRAYAYFKLLKIYGDVPLVLELLDVTSPNLYMGRTSRATVIQTIYDDLDFAALWLPTRANLPAAQYGRVTKSAAWALKSRAALYEGTRAKFHNIQGVDWQNHLNISIAASQQVMNGQGHTLYSNYGNLFNLTGEGSANTEPILIKIYGVSSTNVLVSHTNSRDLENGRMAPTRNFIRQYLYSDGRPAFNMDGTPIANPSPLFVPEANETSYNTILDNRDPRVAFTYFRSGEAAYQGPWVPKTSLGSRTAFAPKKGFSLTDQLIVGATTDRILIRYAEVLLNYAEAKFELNGSISDADLNASVNLLRSRVGFASLLTNTFVTTNNLSMREEIRRERTVELALEGLRYDDLMRWKLAEVVMPKELLGAKFIASEWTGTNANSLNLNASNILIVEPANTRNFRVDRDYLYPVPLHEISTSRGNVTQNPNWQ